VLNPVLLAGVVELMGQPDARLVTRSPIGAGLGLRVGGRAVDELRAALFSGSGVLGDRGEAGGSEGPLME
jgi:hypothetical protein